MDLSLASTEDLKLELLNRYDHAGFVGMKVMLDSPDPKGESPVNVSRRWVGNTHTCIGLLEDLKMMILEDNQRRAGPVIGEGT